MYIAREGGTTIKSLFRLQVVALGLTLPRLGKKLSQRGEEQNGER